MPKFLVNSRTLAIAVLNLFAAVVLSSVAFAQTKPDAPAPAPKSSSQPSGKTANAKPTGKKAAAQPSAEPDKVLYDRALVDMKKSHYIEGRLALQTLINTYPDSEYLAKAKLGVADSYFKEGGTSNTTEAIQEYKDFITFFPFLDEAAYAQMQVGMAHFRMMEKADRDRTDAENAEDEFQTFLLKYPQSPLVPNAEQRLREVQEILADNQYRVARFYYLKMDYSASAARLIELSQRYPLYSQSGDTLWMLGDIYSRAKQLSKNEDDKNHWTDLATQCFQRIVKDYPLSKAVPDAKARLATMGMPVPTPDPNAVAEMKKQQLYQKQHTSRAFVRLPMSMMKSSPNVLMAAHSGQPNLNPPDDEVSATDVLKQGANGPSFNLAMRPGSQDITAQQNTSQGAPVEAVSAQGESSSGPGNNLGVQIIAAPASGENAAPEAPPTAASTPESAPSSSEPSPGNLSAATPLTLEATPATQAATPAPGATQSTAGGSSPAPAEATADTSKADPKTESTSKKKKGIKKIVPF
jgi:outer membrane protein assembly factor BamD